VILLPLLARFIFDRGKYDRVIWIILLAYFSVAICFSFSRGVWISFILAVGFMLLQKSSGIQHKRFLIVGGAVAFFALLLVLPGISGLLVSRAKTITSFGYGSNKARLLRWSTAIMMFLRHPITGCGYGSFGATFLSDPTLHGEYVSQFGLGAHNKYLEVLAETGLLGFTAWMWIIISFFRHGFHLLSRLSKPGDRDSGEESSAEGSIQNVSFYRSLIIGTMAAELSLLVHFLVNSMIQADIIGVPFWLMMGLLPALGNIMAGESQPSPVK
jgi:putative inorganic carbon (HCO3(-)) transporter